MSAVDVRPPAAAGTAWHLQDEKAAIRMLATDQHRGLSTPAAAGRLLTYGPNTVREQPKPSRWQITLAQLRIR